MEAYKNKSMQHKESRETLRQIYQRTDTGEKKYIPAKQKTSFDDPNKLIRVCAYCRVSTDNDEQLSSFELQQEHYRQLVGTHPTWELKHIYADEGISGTSLKKRDAFNEMINACRNAEYDLIITKSVSRFARNLVDCVSLVRELKKQKHPVGVFFETDNLNTLLEESELMLSFLATFAQEESVKKSEAMNWSLKQRFKDGKLLTPELLGYERPRDITGRYIKYGKLQVVENEAEIVRFIFDSFLAGKPQREIASLLTDIECPTKTGGTEWSEGSINYILKNERYCGDVLTWKTFTSDMYEHKHRKNRQDRDQYLYSNHHEAIISLETFEAAQVLLQNRRHGHRGSLPMMQVISDGTFSGYVPINHHWINDDPLSYYEASNSAKSKLSPQRIQKRVFSKIALDGYQVVRGQIMTSRQERPCITATGKRISFNVDCMRKFQNVQYIQLLLHPSERKLAIRPCSKSDIHSIPWRSSFDKPVYQKSLSCQYFESALYDIMEWVPDYSYRIPGSWIAKGNNQIIIFDLSEAQPISIIQSSNADSLKPKRERLYLLPAEWNTEFGKDFYEHEMNSEAFWALRDKHWSADSKSIPYSSSIQLSVLSETELESNLSKIRMGITNDAHSENSI